ncbi:unnamed protein product [Phytomonas sp. Hart1]|nr:unnamed protein product [Phytomonas sp. Hart1]|eukprot:CCW71274.1 unnamed protein product [Phytomonas sp. isolate Hart1]
MLRLSSFILSAQRLDGGIARQPRGSMPTMIQPSILSADVDQKALEIKLQSYLWKEMNTDSDDDPEYVPPLPRKWVKASKSMLSTSYTQRSWFRIMSFNMMVDRYNNASKHQTTPVEDVKVRVPSFTRTTRSDLAPNGAPLETSDGFLDYDPQIDTELPPFLTSEFRRAHLTNTLRHYDPDVVCLNEVNRVFFNGDLWRYVRYLGYGTLYQSSRGARVRVLRKGEDPTAPRNGGKILEEEDIGNVVLFHKGRFTPLLMPGRDLPGHFHFGHFVSMRDKITNLNLNIGCIQLTAGDSEEAQTVRLHETRQILMILEGMSSGSADSAHTTTILCGDLNTRDDEEPCVQAIRERFFSTYDALGGPRWTAWHYQNTLGEGKYVSSSSSESGYCKYYAKNVDEMHRTDTQRTLEKETQQFIRPDAGLKHHGKFSNVRSVAKLISSKTNPSIQAKTAIPRGDSDDQPKEQETRSSHHTVSERTDMLIPSKTDLKQRGIVYGAQDFIFYEPRTLALHQALDIPEDGEIDPQQLFPNTKLPSHHLPLFVDVSFNDLYPDL